MKTTISKSLAVLLTCLSTSACANLASFQEADTLPKGTYRAGGGLTVTGYKVEAGDSKTDAVVPAVNVWGRYGLLDRLELHGMAWMPLGASAGGKYQLIGSREQTGPALSVGGDIGYMRLSTTTSGTDPETGAMVTASSKVDLVDFGGASTTTASTSTSTFRRPAPSPLPEP